LNPTRVRPLRRSSIGYRHRDQDGMRMVVAAIALVVAAMIVGMVI
jgi:hypothetical protein